MVELKVILFAIAINFFAQKIQHVLVLKKYNHFWYSNFYKQKPNNIIAVTGTNGKSSVADFFYQILSVNKILAGSIGTLGVISKNYKKKTNLTSLNQLR